jgi:hypothetical protein
MSNTIAHCLLDILCKQSVSVGNGGRLIGLSSNSQVLSPPGRSASAGLRWCSAMVRRDAERNCHDQEQNSGKHEAAIGNEEPVEGQAGKVHRSSQDTQQVQAGCGAGAVEPAGWRYRFGHHAGDRLAGAFGARPVEVR